MSTRIEQADVVVVGARCAGTATAIPLARAGRTVVVLDKGAFPADTLSTHVLVPTGSRSSRRWARSTGSSRSAPRAAATSP